MGEMDEWGATDEWGKWMNGGKWMIAAPPNGMKNQF
jgi:hypothetical protein